MMRHMRLDHRFVQHLPDRLDPGILYIAIDLGTAAHSCCCGCGDEVVTPFTPTDWSMTYDGETVSLSPSVGNWQQACRSHYVVRNGRVIEAGPWTDEQVSAERRRDAAAKAIHYETKAAGAQVPAPPAGMPVEPKLGFRQRLVRLVSRLWS